MQEAEALTQATGTLEEVRGRYVRRAADRLKSLPERFTEDEAGPMVDALHRQSCLHEDMKWLTRFLMGEVTRRVKKNTERGGVMDLYRRMSDRWGINTKALRYAVAVADSFHGNIILFDRWLQAGGYQKRWYHIKEITRLNVDPTVMGPESLADYLITRLESAAKDLEKTNEILESDEASEDEKAAIQGAQMAFSEEAARLRANSKALLQNGHHNGNGVAVAEFDPELERFVQMIHRMPCMGCGRAPEDNPEGFTHAHHVSPSSMSKKRNDWLRVPLCWKCHSLVHDGYRKFKEKRNEDIRELAARTLHIWIDGEDPRFPPGIE